MLGDPVLSALLDGYRLAGLALQQLSVMLDLADLFDHACAKQGVLVDKGDAYQVVVFLSSTPGYDTGIARLIAKQRDTQFDRGTATEAA